MASHARADGVTSHDSERVLSIVRDLTLELHPARRSPVTFDSALDADLGLDSLALVELRSRLEGAFAVTLPDRVFDYPTAEGWLEAVHHAAGREEIFGRPLEQRGSRQPSDGPPAQAETLLDVLAWHAERSPDRVHLRLLHTTEDEERTEEITYAALAEHAAAVAMGLRHHRLGPTERVGIMLPTGPEYFEVFLGALMAGGIPVPIYPPARPAGLEEHLRRQVSILSNAGVTLLITVPEARRLAWAVVPQVPSLRGVVAAAELRRASAARGHGIGARADDTVLLQYTSGSTGNPKGVVLAHSHLLANIRAIADAIDPRPDDVVVSWLPLYHDMGLIGSWLTSLYLGFELNVMPPNAFLSRPVRWFRAMTEFGATLSPSPNFGYELCVRHVSDDQMQGLDLSRWRLALSGAEPVSPETIRIFSERFASYGFRSEAMTPVYGLAEAGLCVTFPPLGRGPIVDLVDRQSLSRSRRAEPARPGDPAALGIVACGPPLSGYHVRVVNRSGEEVPDRHEGRIEFAGPSATPGYFHNDIATRELCHGEWRDTGDLGYIADGEVYVTGRVKDIIIRAGRNLHPEQLEEAVGDLSEIRKGCVAVFAATAPGLGTERLVVLAESRERDPATVDRIRRAITALTVDLLDTPPDDIVIAPPGTVPKTSSGKIRRAACREFYEAGDVSQRLLVTRWQFARFVLTGVRPQVRRLVKSVASVPYAAYVWLVLLLLAIPTWLLVEVVPTVPLRWRIVRGAGRCMGALCGIRFSTTGSVPATMPFVVTSNHASFIDGLAVVLAVPTPVSFVAGAELATQRIAGPFLRRLDCEFVNEGRARERSGEADRITQELRGGRSFVFFPEGSLDRAPGLRPFHLGAFAAAVAAQAPVVPVGIRGSRDVVRPGGRFPRHGKVELSIGDPIMPAGVDWPAIVALREEARAAILELSGEFDLR